MLTTHISKGRFFVVSKSPGTFSYFVIDARQDTRWSVGRHICTAGNSGGVFGAIRSGSIYRIRKVLGASVGSIVLLLSKKFARLVLIANVIAWKTWKSLKHNRRIWKPPRKYWKHRGSNYERWPPICNPSQNVKELASPEKYTMNWDRHLRLPRSI